MPRPLLHCFVALLLLVQGLGSVWAASGMAAGQLAYAAAQAELPPCHQEASAKSGGMKSACCIGGHCKCAALCAASTAAALAALPPQLPLQASATPSDHALAARALLGHHQRPPRPPAA